jgi:hypothetical protein
MRVTPIAVPASEALTQRSSPGAHVSDALSLTPAMTQIKKMTFQIFRTHVIFRHRNGFILDPFPCL